jgi:hypothetical protein
VGILIQVLPFYDPKSEKQASGRLRKVHYCTCQHIERGNNDGTKHEGHGDLPGRPTLGGGPSNKPQGGGTENGLLLIGRKVQRSCRSTSFHFSDNGWRGCVSQAASGRQCGEKRLPTPLIFPILTADPKSTVPTRLPAQFRPLLKLWKVVPLTD